MDTTLLSLAARLVDPALRAGAAQTLARHFGAAELLVFIRDSEVDSLLPAPGFRQTLPNGKSWRAFVEECADKGVGEAMLATDRGAVPARTIGYGCGRDVAMVLAGVSDAPGDVSWFHALLPLIGVALRAEYAVALARMHARVAAESAHRASALATMLDGVRHALEDALLENRNAAAELERANIGLAAQAEELRDANAALMTARHAAEQGNRAKTDFLATMSHELRTPLNAISGHVQLLAMGIHGPLNGDQLGALDRIERSQRHLLGLINDVLNLSRIEAGRIDYQMTSVALRDALVDLMPMVEPQIAAKRLRLVPSVPDRLPPVLADRDKLLQILLNLLSNAIKFTDAGGTIAISAEGGSGHDDVRILVSDTGSGIPAHQLENIFEPFTQVDPSHSRVGHGVGLGLAISRDLARGMGGDLTATSEIGKGSTFAIRLRAAISKHADPLIAADAPSAAS